MKDLTKRGHAVVLETAVATICNYIKWRGEKPAWYRGVGIGTSSGRPFLSVKIVDRLDEAEARTMVAKALEDLDPDGEVPFDVEVVGNDTLPPGTVEGAYDKWAPTCPFGDNPIAKAGFEAGWAAVFERMKGSS